MPRLNHEAGLLVKLDFFAVKRKEDDASALGQEELGEHSGTLGPVFSYFISYL